MEGPAGRRLNLQGNPQTFERVGMDRGCLARGQPIDAENIAGFHKAAQAALDAFQLVQGRGGGLSGVNGIGLGDGDLKQGRHRFAGETAPLLQVDPPFAGCH